MIKRIYETILSVILIFIVSFSLNTVHAAPIDSSSNWSIRFDNIQIQEGSATATTAPTIADSLTEINYEINLDTPGDFYEFTVDVKNNGSINAILDEVLITDLTAEQQRYLLYTVTYSDNKVVAKNDLLNAGATKTIKVRVEFKRDITAADLPSTNSTLELSLSLHYVQTDTEEPEEPDKPDEPDEPSDEPEKPDTPDEPSEKPDDQEKPSGDNNDNEGKENSESDTNKDTDNKSATPQTGDSILICVAIVVLASVVLIFVKKSDKTEEK